MTIFKADTSCEVSAFFRLSQIDCINLLVVCAPPILSGQFEPASLLAVPFSAMETPQETTNPTREFYIVGIGASAGGLEALEHFVNRLEVNANAAYVLVQHLSPNHKSLMAEILANHTNLPIQYADDGMLVEAGNIYLIPPSKNIRMYKGRLFLSEQDRKGLNFPIDLFLQSLALDAQDRAIGVILSGTGSDGTLGIRAIKEQGGLVLAQQPDSAKFDGMPLSAINTRLVDRITLPERMAEVIDNFIEHSRPYTTEHLTTDIAYENTFTKVLAMLHTFSGVDFSLYKFSTILRRIEHRMGLLQMPDLESYAQHMESSEEEVRLLYREMLIGVTRFFRDPDAFQALDQQVLSLLIDQTINRSSHQLRIWISGCSTGEEVYSVAIMLRERMRKLDKLLDVKIFATDIDQTALNVASNGFYPSSLIADVPMEYLQRYFIKQGDHYQVARELRQMIIFAPHNVLKDPPFSRVDLITCRNLLIYLKPEAQDHVLNHFIYASAPEGFLFLGSSESIAEKSEYFRTVNGKQRIYRNRSTQTHPRLADTILNRSLKVPLLRRSQGRRSIPTQDLETAQLYEQILTKQLPPSFIVNVRNMITHTFGDVHKFLRIPQGQVEMDVEKVLHPSLSVAVGTALHRLRNQLEPVLYQGIPVDLDDPNIKSVDLSIDLLTSQEDLTHAFVVLQPNLAPSTPDEAASYSLEAETQTRIHDLERRLRFSDESLQAAIEELETSNEELQATNEELMASNEELQSTNEELQSTNEELISVNAELQAKVRELTQLNADMDSLLVNLEIATVFTDRELRIRKFTNSAMAHINLRANDVGRPLSHFTHVFENVNFALCAREVLDTGTPFEQRIRDRKGGHFLMRIHRNHTAHTINQGLVFMFIDISEVVQTSDALRLTEARYRSLVEDQPDLICEFSSSLELTYANQAYRETFGTTDDVDPTLIGQSLFALIPEHEQLDLRAELERLSPTQPIFQENRATLLPSGSVTWINWQTRAFFDASGSVLSYQSIGRDITERKELEDAQAKHTHFMEGLAERSPNLIYVYDLQQQRNVYANDAISTILGYTAEEVRTMGDRFLLTLLHPDDAARVLPGLPASFSTMEDGDVLEHSYRMRHADGEWRWLHSREVTFKRSSTGVVQQILGVATDVTSLKAAKNDPNQASS